MYKKYNYFFLKGKGYPFGFNLLPITMVIFLVLFATLQIAADTFAQTITLKQNKIKLTSVLKEIQKQSGYNIFYDASLIPNDLTVDVNFKNSSLTLALDQLLRAHGVGFRVVDKNIILSPLPSAKKSVVVVESEIVQSKIVTGLIADENGNKLANVSVSEKGSVNSTMSDANGSFTIKISNESSVLVISSVGYEERDYCRG